MRHGLMSLLSALLIVCSIGCNISMFSQGEPGSGIITSEDRELESFDQVDLSGYGNVEVVFGQESKVKITTDNNLIDLIETAVEDGELRISFIESISPTDGLKFEITTPNISIFDISGAGNVTMKAYSGDSLTLKTSGAATFIVDGVAESVSLNCAGAGKGSLSKLIAKKADVQISGAGSATVNVLETLKVNISGAGSVSYYGTPEVTKTISGLGRVSQLDESNLASGESE